MVILLVVTAGFQAILNNSYAPLITALPLTLQDRMYSQTIRPIHEGAPEEAASAHERALPLTPDESAAHARAGKASATADGDEEEITEQNKQEGSKNALATLAQQHDDEQSYGFYHPAASRPQRTVWLPRDEFGVSRAEEKACTDAGVKVASANAYVKVVNREKAKVTIEVKGGPPDLIGVAL